MQIRVTTILLQIRNCFFIHHFGGLGVHQCRHYIGYISIHAFSKLYFNLEWRDKLSMGAISLVLFVIEVLVKLEPRWLVMQGYLSDTKHFLTRTSNS